jgi:hypothetical protein
MGGPASYNNDEPRLSVRQSLGEYFVNRRLVHQGGDGTQRVWKATRLA